MGVTQSPFFSSHFFPLILPPRSSFSFYPPVDNRKKKSTADISGLGYSRSFLRFSTLVEDHLSLLFLRLCVWWWWCLKIHSFFFRHPFQSFQEPVLQRLYRRRFFGYPPSILSYSPKRFSNPPPFLLFLYFLFNLSITILRVVFIHPIRSIFSSSPNFFFFHSSLF